MKSTTKFWGILAFALLLTSGEALAQSASGGWKSHDMSRPKPPRLEPPEQNLPAPPPEGAVILFDGTSLDGWEQAGGDGPADWALADDYFEARPGVGSIQSKAVFGDVYLHVEWAAPNPPHGTGQDRGNSGVFLMNRYEVQVLDSYSAETYADGQAGAVYGQYPPLFNVTRPPGEWQSYDIFFRRPRFKDGQLQEPARITVVHNGVVIQNNVEILGPTAWLKPQTYEPHPDAGPIQLQDHAHPVRYRNIWALPLPELEPAPADYMSSSANPPSSAELADYVGQYGSSRFSGIVVYEENGTLYANIYGRSDPFELVYESDDSFALKSTDGRLVFERGDDGTPTRVVFHLGGAEMPADRQ